MAQDHLNTGLKKCVAIGGSAGSLRVLFRLMPLLTPPYDFAVILVLHRKSDQKSNLEDLFRLRSKMSVYEVEDKIVMEPNGLYIAPPDYHVLVEEDGTISLDASEKVRWSRPSIDVTFESVAEVFGSQAMAVLLSGSNDDGTDGLKAISTAGGITVVQDPLTCEMDAMPLSAIKAVRIDHVADVQQIADLINAF